jgi:hypothetical protein
MLTAIFSQFGMGIINGVLDKALEAFKAYENKQITKEQLATQLYGLMLEAVKAIEVAHAEALAKMYTAFIGAMQTSALMQRVWAVATLSQLFVLIWHQFFIPLIVLLVREYGDPNWRYPSSGTTVEWSYLLLAGLLGLGVMGLRAGPGAGSLTGRLKAMVGK